MNQYLVIIGSSSSVMKEYEAVSKMLEDKVYKLMAIGYDAVNKTYDRIDYVATYHPEDLKRTYERRKEFKGNIDYKVISHKAYKNESPDILISFDAIKEISGSSALLGVYAGQKLGFNKIILCGCPLEGKNGSGITYTQFQKGWVFSKQLNTNLVRSMSGWTADFLGKPTKTWLNN
jgi:hypothetical protein